MRTLRLSLVGTVILALFGLLGIGSVTAADGQCQPEKSIADLYAEEAQAKAELAAAEDEVADLLIKLMGARLRESTAKVKLDEATYCLDAKRDADKDTELTDPSMRRTEKDGYVVKTGDNISYVIKCRRTRHTDKVVFGPSDHPAADFKQLDFRLGNTCLNIKGYTTERWIVYVYKDTREPTGDRLAAHPTNPTN